MVGDIPNRKLGHPLRSGAETFFRYWRLWLCIALGTVLIVSAYTLLQKKQYRSEMEFLLENNRSNAVITSDRSSGTPASSEISEQQINSELSVLTSEDVLNAVADPDWHHVPAADRTPAEQARHAERIARFRKHLAVSLVPKSNVIAVSFAGDSPAQAADILSRFQEAYLAQRRELDRPSGTSRFFADEARRYQQMWQQANQAMVVFQQQHRIVSVQQAEDTLSKQITGYADDLRTDQASLAEIDTRVKASEAASANVPPRQPTQQHTTLNQFSVDQMRTLLVQLKNRRTELLTRYTPSNRLVTEVDAQIAQTQNALNEAIFQQGHEDTTDINPVWQQIQNTLVQGAIDRKALQSRVNATSQTISTLQARLSELQSLDVTFNSLEEQADRARENFEIFSQKRDQAQVEDEMDQHKLVNVAVAESPTFTFRPVSPNLLLNGVLGVLSAVFIATAVMYFASAGRTTVASARELEAVSRYPVLATVPVTAFASTHEREAAPEEVTSRHSDVLALTRLNPSLQNFRKASEL